MEELLTPQKVGKEIFHRSEAALHNASAYDKLLTLSDKYN